MLKPHELEERYKFDIPWTKVKLFFQYGEIYDGVECQVVMSIKDKTTWKDTYLKSGFNILNDTQENVDEQVYRGVLNVWIHEFNEWFKVNGELIHDPHKGGK